MINLLNKVSAKAVTCLEQSVKSCGMLRYLSVDVIGKDVLNRNWSSGTGTLEAWKEKLRNNNDDKLVTRMNELNLNWASVGNFVSSYDFLFL